jgi:basic amino acid/polyamine antiporter, APA family
MATSSAAPVLARKLRLFDYFTLSFGTMVGAGWLVLMDDWLGRGGPGAAMLGFGIGGAVLVPIGYVYGKLVRLIPDAASETAYAERLGGPHLAYFAGWMMTLAYLIVCPWEAIAVGKLLSYFFPVLATIPLYTVMGKTIYLPSLLLGLLLTALLTFLNYRGIAPTARFQNVVTVIFLALVALFAGAGVAHGTPANMLPLFRGGVVVGVLTVLQIVPYFMTGFESVPKCVEESAHGFAEESFSRAIYSALAAGIAFYVLVVAVVSYVAPWQSLLGQRFATAAAFQHVPGGAWIARMIFAAALVSLLKVFNGNFVASSRLVFGLGRHGYVSSRIGDVHPRLQTPAVAIALVGAFTAAAVLLGDNLLVAVTEVGSLCSAVGWLLTCLAGWKLLTAPRDRALAIVGSLVALAFVLIKTMPNVPGHLSRAEYISLAGWLALGLVMRLSAGKKVAASQEISNK